eukprot:gnl/TRDRNA2_/TRDRNA2_176567_c1_seq8.p1 gnl/TRDRNA2_/TRDRNA2_176567_c1~~gnl/TRDRNA2_/TRDRNA2_176567_c1_seq8.p1  ORF type:complete len:801 (-),score=89.74 gnl/TRDRNA2_/TRDRNA2_176567_c1_seq8:132-2534(-)
MSLSPRELSRVSAPRSPRDGAYTLLNVAPDSSRDKERILPNGEIPDVLQFSSSIYYANTNEGKISIDIMRIGRQSGLVRAKYHTVDGSAKAGEHYRAVSGEILMNDGEAGCSIDVDILNHGKWATTLEFKLQLTDAEGCELGLYLFVSRVKIITDVLFPSSKYGDQLKKDVHGVSGPGLFVEFFKLTFKSEGVMWRTFVTVAFDQLHNLYAIYKLLLQMYIVDVLFNMKDEEAQEKLIGGSRMKTAQAVGLMYFLPLCFLHVWDIVKIRMDLSGTVRTFVRTNLFRKYLNYNNKSRLAVPASEMQLSLMEDAADLAQGYISTLSLVRIIIKLAILIYFTLSQTPSAWKCVIAMPTLMFAWAALRNPSFMAAFDVYDELRGKVLHFVQESCSIYDLISDYKQRPQVDEVFLGKLNETREAEQAAKTIEKNNDWFTKWLGPTFGGIYLAVMAPLVFSGHITLGKLLATLRIFDSISDDFGDLYDQFIKISSKINPLRGMTTFFNMPTDLRALKDASEKRRITTRTERRLSIQRSKAEVDNGLQSSVFIPPTDKVPIKLTDVSFHYVKDKPVIQNLTMTIPQGQLVAIEGGDGSGKATLTKLLGGTILPTEGDIFIPMHLRVLRVAQEPVLLQRSLWDNLRFGRPNADPTRVKGILDFLDVPERLMNQLDAELAELNDTSPKTEAEVDDDPDEWHHTVAFTDRVKISLARAFIVNPEVMVLHRPLNAFKDEKSHQIVLSAIKTHIAKRGLCMPEKTMCSRRPRTGFFTIESSEHLKDADMSLILERNSSGVTIKLSRPSMVTV